MKISTNSKAKLLLPISRNGGDRLEVTVKAISGPNCIEWNDGSHVHEAIQTSLVAGEPIVLDFIGVEIFASPFFNALVGLAKRDVGMAKLQQQIVTRNLNPIGELTLKRVIANHAGDRDSAASRRAIDEIAKRQAENDDGRGS